MLEQFVHVTACINRFASRARSRQRLRTTLAHRYATPRVVPISVTAAGPRPGPHAETTERDW